MPAILATAIACLIFAAIVLAFLFFLVRFGSRLLAFASELATFCKAHIGANWRTTLTAGGTALFGLLTALAGLSYQMGPLADFIPPPWKVRVFAVSAFAAALLHFLNGMCQKDKNVTGGAIQQDALGNVAPRQVATPPAPAPALPGTGTHA